MTPRTEPLRLVVTCRGVRLFAVGFGEPAPLVPIACKYLGGYGDVGPLHLDEQTLVVTYANGRERESAGALIDCPHHKTHIIDAARLREAVGGLFKVTGKSAARCDVGRVVQSRS